MLIKLQLKCNIFIDLFLRVIYVAVASTFFMFALIIFVGLVIHSAYYKCDPIAGGHINSPDEVISLLVCNVL